jgi:hypothetical protein
MTAARHVRWPAWPTVMRAFGVILAACDSKRRCQLGEKQLARRAGVSLMTFNRAKARLEQRGIVRVIPGRGPHPETLVVTRRHWPDERIAALEPGDTDNGQVR